MFKLIILGLVVILVLGVVAFVAAKLGKSAAPAGVYYARKSVLTFAERTFLGVMEPLLPDGVRILAKVRLEDLLGVKAGLSRPERTAARNRINRKHVDFLLVRASDLSPIAGVELDDSSHEAEDRQERDAFVDSAFASAGLPLLHVPVQKAYNPGDIRSRLEQVLKV